MLDAIIAFALRQRALVLLMTLALIGGGIYAFTRLPIDAVPDITNNQVQILTRAPSLSPVEVERFVTFPIEVAVKSLPSLTELRSTSQSGLSVVTVVFEDDVDVYFARQQVLEKLREAEEEIPEGVERPELAPVSTGLGEIFRYVVRDTTGRLSPMDLRTVQDWIVRRQLLGTPGIAEVNSLGGYVRQYHVLVDPDALVGHDIALRDVFDAVARTSGNAGGAYIENNGERYSVRSVGLVSTLDDLRGTVIRTTPDGTPLMLSDVAEIEIGPAIRFGSASQNGTGEVVTGIAMQLKGANARVTVDAVKTRIDEIRPSLPPGVVIEPYYDRETLVDSTLATVARNLIEGALLVIAVLLLFLVNLRAGLIVASVIPLAMLFAAILMVITGQSGNLMSLGAIDFGLVVDGSLIIVENCLRLLEERMSRGGAPPSDRELRRLVYGGSVEVRKAAQFGELIIIVVYLPILTLQGIEGKLFRPMALTVSYALVGALLLSITYVPVMLSLLMKGSGRIRHSPVIGWMLRRYRPLLHRALSARTAIVSTTAILLVAAAFVFTRLGGEFIPRLDEGDIAMHLIRLPSVSLTESQKITTRVEAELMKFPEVRTVVSSTGRAEISTDPMGFELADAFVMLRPHDEWTSGRTKEELIAAMSEAVEKIPGVGVQFLQPIEMRMNELIAGARGDVVVKIVGEDYGVLEPVAERIAGILRRTDGAADVAVEQTSGLPQLLIRPDRAAIARYGLTVDDINEVVRTGIGGMKAGEAFEGEKRFDIVVRLPGRARDDLDAVGALLVATPTGQRVPLSSLASISIVEGPLQISHEDGYRFTMVQANVRGRDVESFVSEVRAKIASEVSLPPGYVVIYGGQFEHLQAASNRLTIVVPIALGLIFLLLFQTFRSIRVGILIFLCVPMAIIGGVAALAIGGLPFSIAAGVGFIALFGIAVLNGIVMVAAIRKHQSGGSSRRDAVLTGAEERLRPVVTTAALAAFGFLPMLIARGAGAEVQRPLATVIIGGLISSTLLTLFLLPIIYDRYGGEIGPDGDDEEEDDPFADDKSPTRPGPTLRPGPVVGVVLALIGLTAVAHAQERLTLAEVQRRALATAPELQRGTALIERGRAEGRAVTILPSPEIFGSVDEAPSAALTGRSNASLGVSQSMEFPSVYGARRDAAESTVSMYEAEQAERRLQVVRRATVAYVDVLTARELLRLADSAVAVADAFAVAASRRRELGETGPLEELQASLARSNARQRQLRADAELARTTAELAMLIGAAPGAGLEIADSLALGPLASEGRAESDTVVVSHPRVRAFDLAVDVAERRRRVVGLENLPTFGLEYSWQTVDGVGGFYGGGLRLGVPLWRWMSSASEEMADAEVSVARSELAMAERSLRAEVESTRLRYEAAYRSAIDYARDLVPAALETYRLALESYRQGAATYLEVLTAQTAQIETRMASVEAIGLAERLRADLAFYANAGGER